MKKGYPMSYSKNEEMVLRSYNLKDNPITKEIAEKLATQFGKSKRSVISKAVSLKLYKKAERTYVDSTSKVETVRAIEKALAIETGDLEGLQNGRGTALSVLLMSIR